ncbi:hypothetical protein A2U01_0113891, partial [Trifolium medium]|nr:hypothetical protein [Trifolium medium]
MLSSGKPSAFPAQLDHELHVQLSSTLSSTFSM